MKDMKTSEECLLYSIDTGQYAKGVLWLRARLLDACDTGGGVDLKKMGKEFTTVKDKAGLP